mmetsp:Transcript_65205/g.103297  ORF Transcript_65205/g.103297 Transcript_65205/m.103297 type:complete len:228 (-) Transcript_65205:901-1584(-)
MLFEPKSRELRRADLRFVVHINETEPYCVAVSPLIVVHQRPCIIRIHSNIVPLGDCTKITQVVSVEVTPLQVMHTCSLVWHCSTPAILSNDVMQARVATIVPRNQLSQTWTIIKQPPIAGRRADWSMIREIVTRAFSERIAQKTACFLLACPMRRPQLANKVGCVRIHEIIAIVSTFHKSFLCLGPNWQATASSLLHRKRPRTKVNRICKQGPLPLQRTSRSGPISL